MNKMLRLFVLGAILIYVAACGSLFVLQRSFLYFPTPEIETDTAQAVYLENDLAKIKIWKVATGEKRAILYFGGNAEEVSRNISPFNEYLPGYDFYLMNYRGFSGSTGGPSETALYLDALSLYDLIATDYETISVVGRSLGSGVATYVAANRKIEKLALITPYDSIVNVAQSKFPLIPVPILLIDKYESARRADQILAPTLIITAENDAVIPRRFSDALAASMTSTSVQMTEIPSTHHLNVSSAPVFWEIFGDFFMSPEA